MKRLALFPLLAAIAFVLPCSADSVAKISNECGEAVQIYVLPGVVAKFSLNGGSYEDMSTKKWSLPSKGSAEVKVYTSDGDMKGFKIEQEDGAIEEVDDYGTDTPFTKWKSFTLKGSPKFKVNADSEKVTLVKK